MTPLYQLLAAEVDKWRDEGYPCPSYPTIAEILAYQTDEQTGQLRFLRPPQMRALETYWYLRLVLNTPHILDLYRELYPKKSERRVAFALIKRMSQRIVTADKRINGCRGGRWPALLPFHSSSSLTHREP